MEPDKLTPEEKENLLKLARASIEKRLLGETKIEVKTDFPIFNEKRAAFVTLHIHGNLRGCIGQIIATNKLVDTIREMAVSAAFGDPRFPALTKKEYSEIDVEISVLTPIQEIESWKEVKIGVHGIIISKGYYKGLLLPQVATEYGWDNETFISHGCMKAGLPRDEYKRGVKIEIFAANVFGEKER